MNRAGESADLPDPLADVDGTGRSQPVPSSGATTGGDSHDPARRTRSAARTCSRCWASAPGHCQCQRYKLLPAEASSRSERRARRPVREQTPWMRRAEDDVRLGGPTWTGNRSAGARSSRARRTSACCVPVGSRGKVGRRTATTTTLGRDLLLHPPGLPHAGLSRALPESGGRPRPRRWRPGPRGLPDVKAGRSRTSSTSAGEHVRRDGLPRSLEARDPPGGHADRLLTPRAGGSSRGGLGVVAPRPDTRTIGTRRVPLSHTTASGAPRGRRGSPSRAPASPLGTGPPCPPTAETEGSGPRTPLSRVRGTPPTSVTCGTSSSWPGTGCASVAAPGPVTQPIERCCSAPSRPWPRTSPRRVHPCPTGCVTRSACSE